MLSGCPGAPEGTPRAGPLLPRSAHAARRAASGDIPDQRRNALPARQDQFWGAAIIAGAGQSRIVASMVNQQAFRTWTPRWSG